MSTATVTRHAKSVIKFDPKPKASLVEVTPAQAKKWLDLNTHNRPLRERVVDLYARDMTAGNWQVTGDGVKFAIDGSLLDGQHRLAAVVQAGVTVSLFVIRGLAHDAQEVMDSGVKRQASDALALRGHRHTALLAATARIALTATTQGYQAIVGRSTTFTTSEVAAFVAEHPEIEEYMAWAQTTARQTDSSPSVVGYAMWRLHQIDPEDATDFFHALGDGIGLEAGDPVLALRRRLAEARRHRERIGHGAHLSLIFRTWNARREGKSVQRISVVNRSGEVVVPEPA